APSPGGSVVVEAAARGQAEIVLAVRDDGPGIPGDALERVFERFYRGDPARAGGGSGLGLAIVAELARAHGGRAFAERPAGGGARVGVVLPVSGGRPMGAASPTLSPMHQSAPDRHLTMEEPSPVTDPSA
ncbi:MAG TPA: sensor histidine kinase, partial [Candidatus Limnocylindrales bacterium]|nr:sensor histidine kinase [Candidatus Limnocylindrales bacterium]